MSGRDSRPVHRSAEVDELRPVSALFADIVGSTGLGERLKPAEVKAVVGECVSRMCEVVEVYGGVVTGQMGDGIAAFFGLQGAREDDIERSAKAALELRRVVDHFAEEVVAAWGVENLGVRVGLNAGRVAIGPVGGQDVTLIALGDPVNVAARLQSFARPGTIAVGRSIADALTGYELVPLGSVSVKGRVEPVEAFELRAVAQVVADSDQAPLIGRDRELEAALAVVDDLETGRGQVLTIVGDGGIGKSRLINAIRALAPEDITWLEGSCDPIDRRLPYEPFEQALRSFLGVGPDTAPIEVRTRFRTVLGELFALDASDATAHLARFLGIDLGLRVEQQLDGLPPDVLTLGLHRAYGEWLSSLCRRAPVVFVVDNFCDASGPSADLLASILGLVETHALLVVVALRPRVETPGWATRVRALANHPHRCCEIRVRPLSDEASRKLVDAADDANRLSEGARDVVVQRAEGNPLYVEQLVMALGSEEMGSSSVPRALESFLLARVDALSLEGRSLLQCAAVLGRIFADEHLRRMAGFAEFDLVLGELLRADLIREHRHQPPEYRFTHGLLREAALSTLTPQRLCQAHARAATAIREHPDFDVERHGDAVAAHYLAAGDDDKASAYLEALADRLAKLYRYESAIDLYERCRRAASAASSQSIVRIAAKESELLSAKGELERAMGLLRTTVDEVGWDADETFDLRLALAEQMADTERSAEARAIFETCVSTAPSDPARARALYRLGIAALNDLDVARAEDCLRQLNTLGPDVSERFKFESASLRAGVLARGGKFERAERWAKVAASEASLSGRRTEELIARRRLATVQMVRGYVRDAVVTLNDVYEQYSDLGFVLGQAESAAALLSACHFSGDLRLGINIADQVLRVAPDWRGAIAHSLSELLVESGLITRARILSEGLIEDPNPLSPWALVSAWATLFSAASFEADWNEVSRLVSRATTDTRLAELPDRVLVTLDATRSEVALQVGDSNEAVRSAAQAGKRGIAEVPMSVQVRRVLGTALAAVADESGLRLLEETLEDTARFGMRIEAGRCLVGLGIWGLRDRETRLARGRELLTECGSRLGLKYADNLEAVAARSVLA